MSAVSTCSAASCSNEESSTLYPTLTLLSSTGEDGAARPCLGTLNACWQWSKPAYITVYITSTSYGNGPHTTPASTNLTCFDHFELEKTQDGNNAKDDYSSIGDLGPSAQLLMSNSLIPRRLIARPYKFLTSLPPSHRIEKATRSSLSLQ